MTGTGSNTDPYLVYNWTDFTEAVSQAGKYVKLMEDIHPPTLDSPVYIKSTEIDGNGKSIHDFRSTMTVKNANIPQDMSAFAFLYQPCLVKDLTISAFYINVASEIANPVYMSSVFCIHNSYTSPSYTTFQRCKIQVTLENGQSIPCVTYDRTTSGLQGRTVVALSSLMYVTGSNGLVVEDCDIILNNFYNPYDDISVAGELRLQPFYKTWMIFYNIAGAGNILKIHRNRIVLRRLCNYRGNTIGKIAGNKAWAFVIFPTATYKEDNYVVIQNSSEYSAVAMYYKRGDVGPTGQNYILGDGNTYVRMVYDEDIEQLDGHHLVCKNKTDNPTSTITLITDNHWDASRACTIVTDAQLKDPIWLNDETWFVNQVYTP